MSVTHPSINPYDIAKLQFEDAVPYLEGIPENIVEYLRFPKRELTVNFPVKMDNGSLRMFTGYRVHYNNVLGPTKGGIRNHPDVTLDEVRALAMWMKVRLGCSSTGGSNRRLPQDHSRT